MKSNKLCFFYIFFAFTFCAYGIKAQDTNAEVVYKSPVLLTTTMMEQHAQFVQKLLDVTYTRQQKEKHFQLIEEYWIKKDQKGIQNILGNLEYSQQLNSLPAAELFATIKQTRSALIINLIEDAKLAADSQWYLQNYFASHRPLSEGDIPLLKETADALIDCEKFINTELKGLHVSPITQQQKEAAYMDLARQWVTFDYEKKKTILLGSSKMALIFYRWNKMSMMERIIIKKQYVGEKYLTAKEIAAYNSAIAQSQLHLRGQQWGLIQNELNSIKQSTDIIMGRGIRWDPSRNRYVQDGGIVTEFW